jgi:YidC/Oxa1 family membrane protein insertase
MIISFFRTVFYEPLYNGLILLIDLIPWIDAGIAVIIFTCLVRLLLFPLSRKAVRTQLRMKELEPELKALKERYKDKREELARKTLELYKEKGINPFSGILLLLIQLPIIFSLYRIFSVGLPVVQEHLLYAFVQVPTFINVSFLGLIDITQRSFSLALITAITQFLQVRFSMPPSPPKKAGSAPNFGEDLMRSMHFQMKYLFPVVVFFITYNLAAVIALYWTTSNLFTIGQELYIRRERKKALAKNQAPIAQPEA